MNYVRQARELRDIYKQICAWKGKEPQVDPVAEARRTRESIVGPGKLIDPKDLEIARLLMEKKAFLELGPDSEEIAEDASWPPESPLPDAIAPLIYLRSRQTTNDHPPLRKLGPTSASPNICFEALKRFRNLENEPFYDELVLGAVVEALQYVWDNWDCSWDWEFSDFVLHKRAEPWTSVISMSGIFEAPGRVFRTLETFPPERRHLAGESALSWWVDHHYPSSKEPSVRDDGRLESLFTIILWFADRFGFSQQLLDAAKGLEDHRAVIVLLCHSGDDEQLAAYLEDVHYYPLLVDFFVRKKRFSDALRILDDYGPRLFVRNPSIRHSWGQPDRLEEQRLEVWGLTSTKSYEDQRTLVLAALKRSTEPQAVQLSLAELEERLKYGEISPTEYETARRQLVPPDRHLCGCGREVEESFVFCPSCGRPLQDKAKAPRLCATCGQELDSSFRFCPTCGAPVARVNQSGRAK